MSTTPPDSLFASLQKMRRQTVQVVLQPGTRRNVTNSVTGVTSTLTDPMVGTNPLVFEIHSVTANEVVEADRLITEHPPAIYQDEASPSRVGMVRVLKGYDLEDPKYIAARQAQIPMRDAAICLYGCPALAESTPGTTLNDKIAKLLAEIPGVLLDWLCREIETISLITAVGETDVASFLAAGSNASPSSSATKEPTQAGGKNKRSTASTARTSTTKSAKRR